MNKYQLIQKIKYLESTLQIIVDWKDFPETNTYYNNGTQMSYRSCFGSDGERDYIRNIAKLALNHDPNR